MRRTMTKKLIVKRCHKHLRGKLGNHLFDRLIELGCFEGEQENIAIYHVTEKGYEPLVKLGVNLD